MASFCLALMACDGEKEIKNEYPPPDGRRHIGNQYEHVSAGAVEATLQLGNPLALLN